MRLFDCLFVKTLTKAIGLEPLYKEALANRAFAHLRKYEFKNSRTLSKNSGVTVMAMKDKVEIPADELSKICSDLNAAYNLGDRMPMIAEAIQKHCQ